MTFYDAPQYIILGADGDNADGDDAVREGFEAATDAGGRGRTPRGAKSKVVSSSLSQLRASLHPLLELISL